MNNYARLIRQKTNIDPKVILEIGSRDGHDSETLRSIFDIQNANVYVVEPNPNQQLYIKKKFPNFNVMPFAIYNQPGTIKFNRVNDPGLIGISSLLNRADNIYQQIDSDVIEVEAITGEKLIQMLNIEVDLCKIDVEGATYEVIESFAEKNTIKSMHLECEHREIWNGQKLYDDVRLLLTEKGYEEIFFEYVNGIPVQSDSIWVLKKHINR